MTTTTAKPIARDHEHPSHSLWRGERIGGLSW